jgi:hypothetical protein
VDATVVVAAMGLVSTLAAAFGTRWFDYRHQDRTWQRDQRLEAHHAFLNQINRLVHVLQEVAGADPPKRDALMPDVAEALTKTVDAFNRVELVCSPATYDLAVKILVAARADQVLDPAQFPALMQAIGEASRNYREAAKAELRG